MSRKQNRIFWPTLAVALVAIAVTAFVAARAKSLNGSPKAVTAAAGAHDIAPQDRSEHHQPRNLSLRPEAFNFVRRLGRRFSSGQREQFNHVGVLILNGQQRALQIMRKQTDDGERVEIALAEMPGLLTWDAAEGALTRGSRADDTVRALIERLVLDSPDQFALAQLRGASYYTVARSVRPTDADERYAGPLWDIVRVDDPDRDAERRPQSPWRLYYINTKTGLIDKIVSQLRGETIEADVSDWSEQNGEKVPIQITWTQRGQTILQYRLTNFSRWQQSG